MATIIHKDTLRIRRGVKVRDYIDDPDYLVNPIIPANVPLKHLKIASGDVVEMTGAEKATKDTEIQTAIDTAATTAARMIKINAVMTDMATIEAIKRGTISA